MVDSLITLFGSTETAFSSNGIGNLPDAISCTVVEERNGKFELSMEYPVNGKRYEELSLRRILLVKPNPYAAPQPFRIYSLETPINGIVTVSAEHISYDLAGYPVAPFEGGSVAEAFIKMQQAAVVPCPFSFWTDKETVARLASATPASIRALLGGSEGSFLDVYGGEYEFDRYAVKLYNRRGRDRGVSIRYGKNLTDLAQEENCSAVYTGVYPFWYSDQDGLVQLDERLVPAEGRYDHVRILPLDLSGDWQQPPTPEQLRERAVAYMKANDIGVPRVSLTVSFVQLAQSEEYRDLALLEAVHLCDTVHVAFPKLGVSATSQCVSTTYDVLTDKYAKIELGAARASLASTIAAQGQALDSLPGKTQSFVEKAVGLATQIITGAHGGYVLLHSSTGGKQPDEILILDTPDVATARQVWRWNKGGLGHSSTGYNGPYTTAITQDGKIVADFITAGTMNANVIKAGVLRSANGLSMINLDTGNAVLTGSFESHATSGNGRTKGHMDSNGLWTENSEGQRRGVWIDSDKNIVGVFDELMLVEPSDDASWGTPILLVRQVEGGYALRFGKDDDTGIRIECPTGEYDYPRLLLRRGKTKESIQLHWKQNIHMDNNGGSYSTFHPELLLIGSGDNEFAGISVDGRHITVNGKKLGLVPMSINGVTRFVWTADDDAWAF